jgi:hypothetical protein
MMRRDRTSRERRPAMIIDCAHDRDGCRQVALFFWLRRGRAG